MATSQCIDAARGQPPVLAPAMDGVLGHARVPSELLDGKPSAASSAAAASGNRSAAYRTARLPVRLRGRTGAPSPANGMAPRVRDTLRERNGRIVAIYAIRRRE